LGQGVTACYIPNLKMAVCGVTCGGITVCGDTFSGDTVCGVTVQGATVCGVKIYVVAVCGIMVFGFPLVCDATAPRFVASWFVAT
jgi:hypothetical protein